MNRTEERNWAMICHLSSLLGYAGTPFLGLIVLIVLWVMKKEESSFVEDQGREALNFQITYIIYYVIGVILIFVVIGIFVLILLAVMQLIFAIIAAIKSKDGVRYRYPLIIRLL